MRKLKIGDWVTSKHKYPSGIGRVIAHDGVYSYLVRFKNFNHGHDGNPILGMVVSEGALPTKGSTDCLWVYRYNLELCKESRFKQLIDEYNRTNNR